jgi:hypothetical protein
MANINCLEGCRCPECGNESAFQVVATAVFTVVDDGTDEGRNVSWDEGSPAYCVNCEWAGKWGELQNSIGREAA